ncbi:MAG TPA: DoxX family protein [Terracidiphilus sp.]|nr:DoxX family protein [Terracidiphilus sp.]
MESTLNNPTLMAVRPKAKSVAIAYWSVIGLLCLWIAATAYAQLTVPQVADAYRQLGFPSASFRIELAWAKFLGIAALLLPVPARVKEWAFAGFAIDFVSALIAHVSAGQGVNQWIWALVAFVLLAVPYLLRERMQSASTRA